MSEAVQELDHAEDHMDHPTEGQYWLIAIVLAVLTAAEVATPVVLDGWPSTILLYSLMAVKFYMEIHSLQLVKKFNRTINGTEFL